MSKCKKCGIRGNTAGRKIRIERDTVFRKVKLMSMKDVRARGGKISYVCVCQKCKDYYQLQKLK